MRKLLRHTPGERGEGREGGILFKMAEAFHVQTLLYEMALSTGAV
jgi:hypothetical protein